MFDFVFPTLTEKREREREKSPALVPRSLVALLSLCACACSACVFCPPFLSRSLSLLLCFRLHKRMKAVLQSGALRASTRWNSGTPPIKTYGYLYFYTQQIFALKTDLILVQVHTCSTTCMLYLRCTAQAGTN